MDEFLLDIELGLRKKMKSGQLLVGETNTEMIDPFNSKHMDPAKRDEYMQDKYIRQWLKSSKRSN